MSNHQDERTRSNSRIIDDLNRRDVLRKGATAGGALIVGSSAVGGTAARENENRNENQRNGGRGQIGPREDHAFEVREDVPFKLMHHGETERQASCMSDDSAMQMYDKYMLTYCTGDEGWDVWLFVIPDEADVAVSRNDRKVLYEFRSVTDCRADDMRKRVSFEKVGMGPCGSQAGH